MTPETLTCAENIAPEQLSALRDDGLPAVEAQRLRAHVVGCPACQARLADYDALATALRQQRELEPGERIVEGVRARLADAPGPSRRRWHGRLRRPSRRLWAGLATLAPVAAIILLFVYVFGGLAGHNRPATGKTPTIAPAPTITNQYGKPVVPTATPATVSLPPMTPAVSADAAWGTLTPVASYQTPSNANVAISLDALSPDATTLAGIETPANVTPGAGVSQTNLITYDIASGAIRTLGPHWNGFLADGPPGAAVAMSDHYIVYGFNSQPGATCGVCHNTLWAYDRQTGAHWEIDPGKLAGVSYEGDQGDAISGDHVAFTSMEGQILVADLATQRVTLPLGGQPMSNTSTAPQPFVRLDGFSWPNLIYEYSPPQSNPTTPVATTLRIANLQTHVTTILPQPIDTLFQFQQSAGYGSGIQSVSISGDTLYAIVGTSVDGVNSAGQAINTGYDTLYRISHIFSGAASGANGQPEMLARWLPQQTFGAAQGMNARLIVLDGGYVWDIAAGRLVKLTLTYLPDPSGNLSIIEAPSVSLSGNYLLITHAVSAKNPLAPIVAGAVYDTSTLPVR
ncbi:MAG TPA: zf-HC2 domain-containing protein [Ktedonobacterales bacterium]|nr:zf-HC2 domain-containing protein [Ktedonobacterales bacterium]